MKTAEKTFLQLCEEADYWKAEAGYWEEKYKQEVEERNQEWKERSEETMKGVRNAFMFALSAKDDANGNLVIDSESRKLLAENWE